MVFLLTGLLQPRRAKVLNQLGVSWRFVRTDADILWDVRLSELMSFRREHGHVKVSCLRLLPLPLPLEYIVKAFCMCRSRTSCAAGRSVYGSCISALSVMQSCVSVAGLVPVHTGAKLMLMAVSAMQAFEPGRATIWTSCTAAGVGCQT